MKLKYLLLVLTVTLFISGCASTWQDNAGKSLVTIAQTVDSGMKAWETYSVTTGIGDNDPKELQVKALYTQYQTAFSGALAAYNAAIATKDQSIWLQSSAALVASETQLLTLANTFQGKASK